MIERFAWFVAVAAACAAAVAGWARPVPPKHPDASLETLTPFTSHDVGLYFTTRQFEIDSIQVRSVDPQKTPTRAEVKVVVDFAASGATTYQDLPPIAMRAVLSYGWHVIRIEPYGMRKQPGA